MYKKVDGESQQYKKLISYSGYRPKLTLFGNIAAWLISIEINQLNCSDC
ncbi:hypothetical protein GPAL_1152 [Glaciecola pallidula DSM 14239 = ACAM 615]|uniref:Uncharacterized protein n=1 Tax=Brumicola pallidula DSM 14239 = ACAM 615 TaxID=1121922 RepID=K6ZXI2_9ALTE|nr:hypothetical protein GPAL_1152 [Glaciecola pallidula DSM 14239 = ACAM 615]